MHQQTDLFRMSKKFIFLLCVFFSLHFNAYSQEITPEEEDVTTYKQEDFKQSVLLQGINKITATVSSFNLKKNAKTNFGNLEIQLIKCWKAPPEQEPENKALLRIWEQIPNEEKKEIFFGWMFSSSLALSSLEHPVYDIAVKECL